MSEAKAWLAAYLFYGEPWETFLIEAVQPFVAQTLASGAAEKFFFIRYWEQGPHVRLRFKAETAVLAEQVRPQLEPYFTRYFLRVPSQRVEPQGCRAADLQWRPNHTICFVPYEPEIERYGGPVGMAIAEEQFHLSSRVVLELLSSGGWSYERALGAAIQLHLGLAWGLGMSLAETRHFYGRISEAWLNRAYSDSPHLSAAERKTRGRITLEAFAQSFARQQISLVAFHRQYWRGLEDGRMFQQTWLNEWLRGIDDIGGQLAAAREQLILPPEFNPDLPVPVEQQRLWSILGSYVHMTNNRLGILNRDEAYLGYLIVKTLEQLTQRSEEMG